MDNCSRYKMKRRVGGIEEFAIETLSEGTSLRCVLAVSGWIDKDVVRSHYPILHHQREISG